MFIKNLFLQQIIFESSVFQLLQNKVSFCFIIYKGGVLILKKSIIISINKYLTFKQRYTIELLLNKKFSTINYNRLCDKDFRIISKEINNFICITKDLDTHAILIRIL